VDGRNTVKGTDGGGGAGVGAPITHKPRELGPDDERSIEGAEARADLIRRALVQRLSHSVHECGRKVYGRHTLVRSDVFPQEAQA